MRKHRSTTCLCLILIAVLTFAFIPPFQKAYATTDPQGDYLVPVTPLTDAEIPGDYIKITTKAQLNDVRKNLTGKYILMNDIVFTENDFLPGGDYYNSGRGFAPIGVSSSSYFAGIFNGNGHAIVGLKQDITTSTSSQIYGGLFGYINSGYISNLEMEGCNIKVTNTFSLIPNQMSALGGSIAGYIQTGTISNCYVDGEISVCGNNYLVPYAGGIVGSNSGTVENCFFTGRVQTVCGDSSLAYTGGLTGNTNSTGSIVNSYNTGYVNATNRSASCVGGISGGLKGNISGCYNLGEVSTTKDNYSSSVTVHLGGVAGYVNGGTLRNSYNSFGEVTAYASGAGTINIGGLAGGLSTGTIRDCFNTGSLYVNNSASTFFYLGGLIGHMYSGTLEDSYNTGSLAYATYSVSEIGGIIGLADAGTITDNYFLNTISIGIGQGTGTTTKLLLSQMKTQSAYSGFDFAGTWKMSQVTGMPTLQNVRQANISAIRLTNRDLIIGTNQTTKILSNPYPVGMPFSLGFSSSNQNIVTVDSTGEVTGVGNGSASISVTDSITGITEICTVAVVNGIEQIEIVGQDEVGIGEQVTFEAMYQPESVYDNTIVWSSSDSSIASVNQEGIVTGISQGQVQIYADPKIGSASAKAVYDVRIIRKVQSIDLTDSSLTLDVGKTYRVYATILPTDATYKYVFWSTADDSVATVSSSGLITGVGKGVTTITATTSQGGISATCQVEVRQPVEGVTILQNGLPIAEYGLLAGQEIDLDTAIYPVFANDSTVTWQSSNAGIAMVDQEGKVTALSSGLTIIKAVANDGSLQTDSCLIKVGTITQSLDFDLSIYIGQTKVIEYSITPLSAAIPKWQTSDSSILTIDESGTATAIKKGTVTVTAFAADSSGITLSKVLDINPEYVTITFNTLGGTQLTPKVISYNSVPSQLAIPSKTGFTFAGWYRDEACTNAWILGVDRATEDITLYAKWDVKILNVSFDSQGGSQVDTISVEYNKTIPQPTNPVRFGYTFGGWYTEANCVKQWNFSVLTVRYNMTLYAKWIPEQRIVSFDSQGGSPINSVNANYDAPIATPASPTKTGYTFGGWFKEPTCTNAWSFTTDKVTADTTLYAKWTPINYTVGYSGNGATSGSMSSLSMTYDAGKALTANGFVKTGYAFLGWATTPTGAVAFSNTATVKNLTATDGAIYTLYAKWGAPISTAVSYNYNSIKVSWAYAGSATSYKIYRATSATGTYSLVYTASSTARSWVNTSLVTGKTYYYKVYPVAGGKTYAHSTYKYAKAIPTTPTVTLSKASTTSIKVTWTGVSGATKYQVYRATSATGTYSLAYTASSTLRSWTNTGLTAGKTYYYKVRAYHLEGATNIYGNLSSPKSLLL